MSDLNEKTIPFELLIPDEIEEKKPISELYGMMAGEIRVSDDFDGPLEEMKDYMQ